MKIVLKNVRLAFPDLFTAKAFAEGEPAFGATFLLEKEGPAHDLMETTVMEVMETQWPDKKKRPKADKICLKDGDEKSEYAGFEGHMSVSARNKTRPDIRAQDGKTPLVAADGKPYGGCYVNGIIDIWAMDNKWGRRVNATLLGVQFKSDGDAFGGGAPAADADFDTEDGEDYLN